MATWEELKALIDANITTNHRREVSGAKLQAILHSIVSNLGENATFKGIATPTTVPGTPDGNVFYLAVGKGIYSNFNSLNIGNYITALVWNGSWSKLELNPIDTKTILALNNYSIESELFKINGSFNFIYRIKADGTVTRHIITSGTYTFTSSNQALVIDITEGKNVTPYLFNGQVQDINNSDLVIIAITDSEGKIIPLQSSTKYSDIELEKQQQKLSNKIISIPAFSIGNNRVVIEEGFSFLYVEKADGTVTRHIITSGTYTFTSSNQALVIDITEGKNVTPYLFNGQVQDINNSDLVIIAITDSEGKISITNVGMNGVISKLMTAKDYHINGIEPIRISENKLIVGAFTFVYKSNGVRVRINAGSYNMQPHNCLVVKDDGEVIEKSFEDISIYRFPVLGYADANGKIYVNSFQTYDDKINKLADAEYIVFSEQGSYIDNGTINLDYHGFHKEIPITKTGIYYIGWSLGGEVRKILAVDENDDILQMWNQLGNTHGFFIDVPKDTVKLLATSYGTPQNGYLRYIDDSLLNLAPIQIKNDLIEPYRIINGNPWSDGLWKNAEDKTIQSKLYRINDVDRFDLYFDPSVSGYGMAVSNKDLLQLSTNENFGGIYIGGNILNSLASVLDTNTINGYTAQRNTITNYKFPTGAKTLIVLYRNGSNFYGHICRLYKRNGAKGAYKFNPNINLKAVICGDSVSQNPQSEIGKELIRNLLNIKIDTYGIGGAGFCYNATPRWVTPNNVSGVMQVEELVKPASKLYDIYLLSNTLNDPITHNKAVGNIRNCYPYAKLENGTPNFTDPNLDTLCGALNFCIQRIYEKNPNAKIILSTASKCFLQTSKSGYDLEAGWNPFDTSVNQHGNTYYEFVNAVRNIAQMWNLPVADIYKESGINTFNKSTHMIDEYHPTESGYMRFWNIWKDAILKS